MKRRHSVGLTDVAQAAGVSSSTASRALRGESRVSEATVERVRTVAAELGYVPDKRAAQLRSHGPTAVGLVLRSAELSFYGAIAAQMQASADEQGIELLIANGGDDERTQRNAIDNLLGHRVAGVLFASGRASTAAVEHAAAFVPTVLVGAELEHPKIDSVCISPASERQLASVVLDAGHRRVGVLGVDVDSSAVLQRRVTRFDETLRAGDSHVVRVAVGAGNADIVGAVLRRAVETGVTAIMAGDDLMAVLRVRSNSWSWESRAPVEKVSVTGIRRRGSAGGTPLIGLTTVKQPVEWLARVATDRMIERLTADRDDAAGSFFEEGQLVVGATLGEAPRR